MTSMLGQFENQGYLIIDDLIDEEGLQILIDQCESEFSGIIGTRNLLQNETMRSLAEKLRNDQNISQFLSNDCKAVQCSYFNKSVSDNWSVTSHRDLSIPVANKIDSDKWSGWSKKEGVLYAQPPRKVLESLIIVRIHLEHNNHENGALRVVPGSHLSDGKESEEVICDVRKGGALIMRPLVVHKSSKLQSGTRRVLHFIFGPHFLPNGANWP